MSYVMVMGNQKMKKKQDCYMDADSFIVHLKTDDIYKNMQKMLKQDLTLQNLN